MIKRRNKWAVQIGEHEWAPHTYPRSPGDDLRLIGSVRRGPQRGALAQTSAGDYVQVVGDHLTPLNRSQIAKAIAAASASATYRYTPPPSKPITAPTVVIKRRRIPVLL